MRVVVHSHGPANLEFLGVVVPEGQVDGLGIADVDAAGGDDSWKVAFDEAH